MDAFTKGSTTDKGKHGPMAVIITVHAKMAKQASTDAETGKVFHSLYTKRRQTMGNVTEWLFYLFLIFKLFRVAKLKFPTFPQSKLIANCSGQP